MRFADPQRQKPNAPLRRRGYAVLTVAQLGTMGLIAPENAQGSTWQTRKLLKRGALQACWA